MASDMLPRTKELKEKLELIGFKIVHRGCDHYRIINQYGNQTQFEVFDDRVKVLKQCFGAKGAGSIHFNLRVCNIEHDVSHQMVSILAQDKREEGEVFISFYGRKR